VGNTCKQLRKHFFNDSEVVSSAQKSLYLKCSSKLRSLSDFTKNELEFLGPTSVEVTIIDEILIGQANVLGHTDRSSLIICNLFLDRPTRTFFPVKGAWSLF
jgi:hypothetical protein